MPRRRLAKLATSLAAYIVLLASCGGGTSGTAEAPTQGIPTGMEQLVEAAQDEGQLNFYAAVTRAQSDRLANAFSEKYGIEVNVLRLSTGPMVQRYSGEAQAGDVTADILEVATPEIYNKRSEWFVDLSEANIPGYEDWPKEYRQQYFVGVTIFPYSITYNTNLVPEDEVPTSWTELASDNWSGKVLFTDPRSSPTYMGWADLMEEVHGPDYLTAIGEVGFDLVQSGTPGAQQVAAGAYAINYPSQPVHLLPLFDAGAPVDYRIMENPTITYSVNLGISADAPHPAAARLFTAWLMTAEAQRVACGGAEGERAGVASPLSVGGELGQCIQVNEEADLIDYGISDGQASELLDALGIS